ncbi:MAG: hypothetical protein KC593_19155 [Myxococcales bacterium]|nr:hypothetical protein [Myxococcales bacterium]
MNQGMSQGGGNNTMKIVGITCGVLLLLSCCCGGGFFALGGAGVGAMLSGGPKGSTDAFLDELRANNHAQAFQRMGGQYQATHDVTSFTAAVATMPALTQFTDRTMNNIQINNNTGTVSGVLTTPQGAQPVVFQCTKQGEYWYIDQVTVGGMILP